MIKLKPTQTRDMQVIRAIASPLPVIAHTQVAMLLLGDHKSRG